MKQFTGSDIEVAHSWRRPSRAVIIVGAVVVVALAALLTFFILRGGINPGSDKSIVDRVGKHIMVPENETPNIMTVEKASDLTSQPFFAEVKDGDKILVYAKSARVIIYRPSKNILINVGPIVDDNE